MYIEKNGYYITDDKSKLDKNYYSKSLKNTYWASRRSDDVIDKSLMNSAIISVFHQDKQIGFTRLVTDYSTFSYVCDVYIEPEYRGRGLSIDLMNFVLECPAGKTKGNILITNNAAGLYGKFGFETNDELMVRRNQIS
ncbi:MAG TPA: GNAT family N-acetyltransferase [Victivallales bacterium]|nr:GNAT family N-acetyltransferase [Victivallales bacterium]